MWKKVENVGRGRPKKSCPVVSRYPSQPSVAKLLLPDGFIQSDKTDIYSDGDRLAFRPSPSGAYVVSYASHKNRRCVHIPSPFYKQIPLGSTDVSLTEEGGMFILDLSQPALAGENSIAAE